MDRKPHISPPIALLFGILAASSSSIFIRFAQTEASSIAIATLRLLIATLFLVPLMVRQPRNAWPAGKRSWMLAALSGVFLALHFATWIASLEFTSVASSVVLVQTAPLFVAVFSPLFLDERTSSRAWLGLVIAFAGGALIAFGDTCTLQNGIQCPPLSEVFSGTALTGDILALIGGIAGAAYLMIGREVRSQLNLVPYISIVYGAAATILLLWAIFSGEQLLGYSWQTYGWFLLLAIFPQLLAHSTYNWALKYLPATSVSLSLLGEPISAAILAWLILNETVPGLRIMGGLIVLAGIVLAVYRPARKSTQDLGRE